MKKHHLKNILIFTGAGLVTIVAIMYVKKCYVVVANKRYGFNPNA